MKMKMKMIWNTYIIQKPDRTYCDYILNKIYNSRNISYAKPEMRGMISIYIGKVRG